MFSSILWMTLITFIPALELRASIPYGIFATEVPWYAVFLVCVAANVLVGWLVFWLMGPVFQLFRKIRWFDEKVWPKLERRQEKLRPYVEKYGEWGVAVFIGVPLPGTGVFTGAFGAYLLKLNPKKFSVANIAGVLIAGVAVTALCLLIQAGFVGKDSLLARVFLNDRMEQTETVPESTMPAPAEQATEP